MTRSFSAKKQILFLLIIFVFFSLMLEFSYRTYQYFRYGYRLFSFATDDQTNEAGVAGVTTVAVTNPLLHYVLNPDKLSHTTDNFRVTGNVELPDYTVACMGGSSTYGISVSAEDSYPAQLQTYLNQSAQGQKC